MCYNYYVLYMNLMLHTPGSAVVMGVVVSSGLRVIPSGGQVTVGQSVDTSGQVVGSHSVQGINYLMYRCGQALLYGTHL